MSRLFAGLRPAKTRNKESWYCLCWGSLWEADLAWDTFGPGPPKKPTCANKDCAALPWAAWMPRLPCSSPSVRVIPRSLQSSVEVGWGACCVWSIPGPADPPRPPHSETSRASRAGNHRRFQRVKAGTKVTLWHLSPLSTHWLRRLASAAWRRQEMPNASETTRALRAPSKLATWRSFRGQEGGQGKQASPADRSPRLIVLRNLRIAVSLFSLERSATTRL